MPAHYSHTWRVLNIMYRPEYDGHEKFVTIVDYEIEFTGNAAQPTYHRGRINFGGTNLTADTFTPFNELTEAQVIEWIKAYEGERRVKNMIDKGYSLHAEHEYPSQPSQLPWNIQV